jgi:glycosyltransferase involved in cell wall biosynthesis
MRVLQVNKFLYPHGGSETVLFQTAELLKKNGHSVRFFGMEDERNVPAASDVAVVSKRDFSGHARATGLKRLERSISVGRMFYSREAEQRIAAFVEATRPDVAHFHNVYHQLSPSVLRPLRRRGIPVVLTLHDYKLICPNYSLFTEGDVCERCKGHRYYNAMLHACVQGSRMKGALCALEAYVHRATGAYDSVATFIAPSRFVRDKMVEFGMPLDRIIHLANFVDVDAFEPCYEAERYFVYAGRVERVKGVETLIRAVGNGSAACDYGLRIAGDGELKDSLEEQCRRDGQRNVVFLGRLPRAELARCIRRALFVVAPSEWYENAPMSVLEAYAYGKPVIGARIGGIPELVEEGRTGLLFEPGNAGDLRSKIECLLANPRLAAEMGRNARRLVEQAYAPAQHYERLMTIYSHASSQTRSS